MGKTQSQKPIKLLLACLVPYKGQMVWLVLCAFVSTAFSVYAPVLTGQVVDRIAGAGNVDFPALAALIVPLAAAIGISALFQWLMLRLSNRITCSLTRDLRIRAFAKLHEVPVGYLDSHKKGDILSRIVNDIDQIADGLRGFSQLFTGIVTIAGTIFFMLRINASVALVVIVITPLSLFVAAFIARRSYTLIKKQAELSGELLSYAEEYTVGKETVAAFSYEKEAEEGFSEINSRMQKNGVKAQLFSAMINPSTRFVNALVYAAVGIYGAATAIAGALSIGQLSSFLIYAGQYTRPFNEISGVVSELQTALASVARVFELLDAQAEPQDAAGATMLEATRGEIAFENVSFSYTPDRRLIEGLTLHASTGERVAIVGPTGAGKTTLINLLMRFYDAGSGKITLDGLDIMAVQKNSLRGMYGMVLQDTWLMQASVRENIAYGRPDATEEEVVAAAKSAHAHSFIRRLPDGYNTVISEEGGNLSAGQKQLLCIARAMLVSPPMLLLDEATSNIDTRTEMKIQDAFGKMMDGKTSFIVAHRLSTIREADIILVMKDGAIAEQGSHSELMEKNGFYAQMYGSQYAYTAAD
ncbi:MAG: ABC transporter ATP-binding protein [Christensenellaceae bacterium]|jgi:ATP-binding cassette subfamily B multidrug efflux pump